MLGDKGGFKRYHCTVGMTFGLKGRGGVVLECPLSTLGFAKYGQLMLF